MGLDERNIMDGEDGTAAVTVIADGVTQTDSANAQNSFYIDACSRGTLRIC